MVRLFRSCAWGNIPLPDIVSVLADPPEELDIGSGFHFLVAEASTKAEAAV